MLGTNKRNKRIKNKRCNLVALNTLASWAANLCIYLADPFYMQYF